MRLGLAMVCLVLATSPARAGSVTVQFAGITTLASGIDGADAGTLFSGTYTYDDGAALQALDADSGLYDFSTGFPLTGFSLVVQAPTQTSFSGSPLRDISVDDTAGADSLIVIATTGAGGDFRLDLSGGPGLFSSLDLVVPDLSQAGGTVQYTNFSTGLVLFMGTLTSLSAVPEPASAALLGLGIAALAWRRSRPGSRAQAARAGPALDPLIAVTKRT